MDDERQQNGQSHGTRRSSWVLVGFLLVAAFFLWAEHRAHLFGMLPYLLILACPLMHLLHHGHGRGRHGAGASRPAGDDRERRHAGESQ